MSDQLFTVPAKLTDDAEDRRVVVGLNRDEPITGRLTPWQLFLATYEPPETASQAYNLGHTMYGRGRLSKGQFFAGMYDLHEHPESLWKAYKVGRHDARQQQLALSQLKHDQLPKRQKLLYEAAALVTLNAYQAGDILHAECSYCLEDQTGRCQYAEKDGRQVLEALRKKGLLRRDRHHVYRRADSTPVIAPSGDPADIFGF
jgi:hypothetical protein